ncbi:hypothetical protein [Streptomyces sp. NPDC048644]|uniref:hypothetical protein n=1 Tax=Streptomyces sp. NPDC048644 TaxID=3365582 RepID=UPI0037141C2D
MTDETANSRGAKEAGGAGATGEASAPVTDASEAAAPRQEQDRHTAASGARTSSASADTVKGSADGLTLRPERRPETEAPAGTGPDAPSDGAEGGPAGSGSGSGTTVLRPDAPLPGAAEETGTTEAAEAAAELEAPAAVRDAGDEAAQASAAPAASDASAAAASEAPPQQAGRGAGKQGGAAAAGGRRGLGLFRRTDAAAGAAAGAAADAKADGSRVSPGVVAGAALAGVVLLAAPFAISALSNAFASSHAGATGNAALPMPDDGGDGGRGFVPVPGAAQNDSGRAPQAGDHASGNGAGDKSGGTGGTGGTSGGGGGSGPHTDGNAGAHAATGGDDHGKKADAPDDKGTHAETRSQTTAAHTFTAYAGPTCGASGSSSYHEIGAYGDGKDGWLTRTGGSSAGGCQGGVRALPMSGDADKPDSDVTAYWQFNSGMKSASCRISVYIPQGKSPLEVGGSAARYSVHKGTKAYGGDLAGFHIDQPHNKGSWVPGTTVHVEGGRFTLRLTNAGQDWDDDGPTQAHVAASQVKAECRAE